jgi:hypothetical protein
MLCGNWPTFVFQSSFLLYHFGVTNLQSCGAFSIYVNTILTYPYNIFRQGTKKGHNVRGTPFVLDNLQIAHIAHPTFAFNFELSSFQHSTFRLNRIKWKWRHLIFWTQFLSLWSITTFFQENKMTLVHLRTFHNLLQTS